MLKFFILIHLLHSSTCFKHYRAHLQEDNCINTTSGIVTLFVYMSMACIGHRRIHRHLGFYKYFGLMMVCIGRNLSPLFKSIKYKIIVFDDVHISSYFNTDFIVSLLYELTENVRETNYFISLAQKL